MNISNTKAKKVKKLIATYRDMETRVVSENGADDLRLLHQYGDEDLDKVVNQLSSEEGRSDFDVNKPIGKKGLTLLHLSTLISDKDGTNLLLGLGADVAARSYISYESGDYITPMSNSVVNYKMKYEQSKEHELQIVKSLLQKATPQDLVLDESNNLNIYHLAANLKDSEEIIKLTKDSLWERGFEEEEKMLARSRSTYSHSSAVLSGASFSPVDFYIFNNNADAMGELLSKRSGKDKLEILNLSHAGMTISKFDDVEDSKHVFPSATNETSERYKSLYSGAIAQNQVEEAQAKIAEMNAQRAQMEQRLAEITKAEEDSKKAFDELWKESELEEKKSQTKKMGKKKGNKRRQEKLESKKDTEQIVSKNNKEEDSKGWHDKVEKQAEGNKSNEEKKWVEKIDPIKKHTRSGSEEFENMFDKEVGRDSEYYCDDEVRSKFYSNGRVQAGMSVNYW